MHLSPRQLAQLNGDMIIPPHDRVMERLSMLETMVRNIRFPDVAIPQPADLTPVIARLDSIEAVLAAIPKPPPVDLDPVMARLGKLERAIAKAADHHATYNFDIKRDDSGKITEVTATEKPVLLMGM